MSLLISLFLIVGLKGGRSFGGGDEAVRALFLEVVPRDGKGVNQQGLVSPFIHPELVEHAIEARPAIGEDEWLVSCCYYKEPFLLSLRA